MATPQLFSKLSTKHKHDTTRDSIGRDLVWLMNCAIRGARLDLPSDSFIARSVFNYGNPSLQLLATSRIDPDYIALYVRDTLVKFEPRLIATTIRVQSRIDTDSVTRQVLYFDINGVLKAEGTPLFLRLALDYMSDSFSLYER